MYTLIIIFYASFLGIITMLLLKRREVKTGKRSILSRMGAGADRLFNAIFGAVKQGFSYFNKHTFIAISQWIAFHVLLRIRNIYVELKHRALVNPHTRKVIDAVRGRGEVRKEGVSLYLRRISTEE
jgi:preprotein translocase subunit SecG